MSVHVFSEFSSCAVRITGESSPIGVRGSDGRYIFIHLHLSCTCSVICVSMWEAPAIADQVPVMP